MEQALIELLKTSPAMGIMAFFAWAMLKIVQQVLTHQQGILSGVLGQIVARLEALDKDVKTILGAVEGCPKE